MSWLARSLANSLIADDGRTDRDAGGASTSGVDPRSPIPAESDEVPNRTGETKLMSWLARSLANSLIADDGRNDQDAGGASTSGGDPRSPIPAESDEDPNRGVKEDLSELTQTLTRQFWGVASFLAPPASISPDLDRPSDPPASDQSNRQEAANVAESPRMVGIRSDFAEIGGRFRSGISKLSNSASIGRIASNFIPLGSQEEEEQEDEEVSAVGVTEEVLAFAMNIAMHPETWLDFPLFDDFEETYDFEMSDAQQEHALAVESLLPRLAALRIELCPAHMTEGCFWKIYFVLLHSRLIKRDAELLSTPQIAEARTMLLQKLQIKYKSDDELSSRDQPYRSVGAAFVSPRGGVLSPSGMLLGTNPANLYTSESPTSGPATCLDTDTHVAPTDVEIVDMSTIEDNRAYQPKNRDQASNFSEISIQDYDDDDDGDEWLEEEAAGLSPSMSIPYGNQEDVSFSDLEEEDELVAPSRSKALPSGVKTSTTSASPNP